MNFKEQLPELMSVTLVNVRGSAPQVVGARAFVDCDGLSAGTVGGGKIEARAIEKAQQLIQEMKATEFVTWNLQKDIGMTCGGEVSLFFEKVGRTEKTIALFGAATSPRPYVLFYRHCQ